MAEKTNTDFDFEAEYNELKAIVKRQLTTKRKSWEGKTAIEALTYLLFVIDYREECTTQKPTSWKE